MRAASGCPRDFYIFPRNCRVPKSWPPPGWEVPADGLAFLREGESQRDYFARAAQQAIDKLGEHLMRILYMLSSVHFLSFVCFSSIHGCVVHIRCNIACLNIRLFAASTRF